MLIPIRTDNPLRRTPTVNYALIIINVIIFIMTRQYVSDYWDPRIANPLDPYKLSGQSPLLWQFITYAFLHGGWMHLIGNMLFLYIFGNNVNDKLGNVGYLFLYLGGAVFAGLGHVITADAPVLGASGAVAAVTGAYMVLFPLTNIEVLYVIIFIGSMEVPAAYFILFKLVVWDNIIAPQFGPPNNIATTAHLAGYLFGISVPMALLALKLLPHSHFDLWALAKRWRRRVTYRRSVAGRHDPFSPQGSLRRNIKTRITDETPQAEPDPELMKIRAEISEFVYAGNLTAAAQAYLRLLAINPTGILPQQQQLDIANQLMHDNHHPEAAAAYELFLKHYKKYPFTEQVQLMLGLLYSRYLDQNDLARTNLTAALTKLTDPGQKKMCQDELNRL